MHTIRELSPHKFAASLSEIIAKAIKPTNYLRNMARFGSCADTMSMRQAKFHIGQVVKHRLFPFRGVIYDVDPVFANTEEWWQSIPEEIRPRKDQPFYHMLAENDQISYEAYVSEQNLLPDESGAPVDHPDIPEFFGPLNGDRYEPLGSTAH